MSKETLAIWEDIFRTQAWGKYPPLPLVRFVARNFYKAPERKDVRILEIGSGAGANLWFMAREGFTVYGIDGSPTANEQALQYLEVENLADRIGFLKTGDYCKMLDSLENGFFDAVVDVESLCCNPFSAARDVIRLAVRKLKPGGKMFSMAFAEGSWGLDGVEIDHHACYPDEGPMTGLGFSRYLSENDIPELYQLEDTTITNVERHERHLPNQKVIREWVVEVEKKP